VPLVIMVINMPSLRRLLTRQGKLLRVKTSPPQKVIDPRFWFLDVR